MNYHERPELSNSMLNDLAKSSKGFYLKHIAKRAPKKESRDFILGSALHCLVLEPEEYPDRFAILPECDRRTKEGKRIYAEFEFDARLNKKDVITQDEHEEVEQWANALCEHSEVAKILNVSGAIEDPILFDYFGLPFRCKPDLVCVDLGIILDVKTTKSVHPDRFPWSMRDYGYHRQAALYTHACEEKYGHGFRFVFACVEKTWPYEVACYEADSRTLSRGRESLSILIDEYKRRVAANDWTPAHSKGVPLVACPMDNRYDCEVKDE